jgi:hypothetical protein
LLGANTLAYWASSAVTKEKSFITLAPDDEADALDGDQLGEAHRRGVDEFSPELVELSAEEETLKLVGRHRAEKIACLRFLHFSGKGFFVVFAIEVGS